MVTMAGDIVGAADEGLWIADAVRLAIIAACIWLAALVLRLGYVKRRLHNSHPPTDPPCQLPHPLVYVSYAASLLLISGLRIKHFGETITPDLWWSLVVLVPGLVGVLLETKLYWRFGRPKEKR